MLPQVELIRLRQFFELYSGLCLPPGRFNDIDDLSLAFDRLALNGDRDFDPLTGNEPIGGLDFRAAEAEIYCGCNPGSGVDVAEIEGTVGHTDAWVASSLH